MRPTGLLALLAATAAAVAIVVILSAGGGNSGDARLGSKVLPDLATHAPEIARVAVVHGGVKTTLVRGADDRWGVAEKGGYPADLAKLHKTLLGLAELTYVEPKTSKADYYPRLEVEDAGKEGAKSTLVTVSDAKGTLLGELVVGKHRLDQLGGGSDGVYVRKPGDAQSWLARGTLDLSGDASAWLERNVVDIPAEDVKEAVLTQPDGEKLAMGREKPGDKLALQDVPADTKLASEGALVEPSTALTSVLLSDVRPAADLPVTEGASHAEFTTFAGLTVKVALFDKDGASWAKLEAHGSGEAEKQAQELQAKLARWVYAIPKAKADALRLKLKDVVAAPKPS